MSLFEETTDDNLNENQKILKEMISVLIGNKYDNSDISKSRNDFIKEIKKKYVYLQVEMKLEFQN